MDRETRKPWGSWFTRQSSKNVMISKREKMQATHSFIYSFKNAHLLYGVVHAPSSSAQTEHVENRAGSMKPGMCVSVRRARDVL